MFVAIFSFELKLMSVATLVLPVKAMFDATMFGNALAAITMSETMFVATMFGNAFAAITMSETMSVTMSETKSKKEEEEKRKKENLSTTKIVQDVNRGFLVFCELISEKEEKKKRNRTEGKG